MITKALETDVPTLQRLARENWALYLSAIERLKKARQQRDSAREEAQQLQQELKILLDRVNLVPQGEER